MKRFQIVLVVLTAAGLLQSACLSAELSAKKPNVLFILADDLGYSDLGCYGGEIRTPNLDALAQNGLRFTQFYNTARCWPSRAAVLTGFYAQQVRRDAMPGVPRSGGQGVRPAWAPLLPAILKPLGYRSYHSGKWHIDGKAEPGGFDRSYSIDDHNNFFSPQRHSEDDQPLPPVLKDSGYYATITIADHAIKCLKEHAEKYTNRPFFHYLCFTAPHFPLHALQGDIDKYKERYRWGWDVLQLERAARLRDRGIASHRPPLMERQLGPPYQFTNAIEKLGTNEVFLPTAWKDLTDAQREFQATKMAIHAAMVDRMDREIGRVLEQLKAMGAFENTAIFFASDNGASAEIMVRGDGHDASAFPGSSRTFLCLGPGWSSVANTPFRRHKTWVHEGGISTPLIVHWPAGISTRNELRGTPAHLVDIVPTILELAGGSHPLMWNGQAVPPPPGRSLVSAFASDRRIERDCLWWLHDGHRAIRVGDWKLVANKGGSWELYDLGNDRGETRDLASEHRDRVGELSALWNTRAEQFRALALRDLPPEKPGVPKGP